MQSSEKNNTAFGSPKVLRWCILLVVFNLQATAAEHQSNSSKDLKLSNVVFIVLSQSNDFHEQLAEEFRLRFIRQLQHLEEEAHPRLLFTHKELVRIRGAWTVFPLLEKLIELNEEKPVSWAFICEETTDVKLMALVELLSTFDSSESHFLGRALRDKETTIIHHFAFPENPSQFAYPDFTSGFALSMPLIQSLAERLHHNKLKTDFTIDPKHELAMFVWDNGNGTVLTPLKEFCPFSETWKKGCVTHQTVHFPSCGAPIEPDQLFVAVKTCQKFHSSRLSVVKKTWGKEAALIEYYSEVADKTIPTIDLGIPNTERGHCGKTMAIINRVFNSPELQPPRWILIADDDTIINLKRLRSLLACYNPLQPIALGERYGYGMARGGGGGYDYITGGGGMVFTQRTIRILSQKCNCYSDDAPDDMTLGMCLRSAGIPIVHSPYFHQARPDDYSPDFLADQLPVSFHKHWNNDPYKVYADLTAGDSNKEPTSTKDEL